MGQNPPRSFAGWPLRTVEWSAGWPGWPCSSYHLGVPQFDWRVIRSAAIAGLTVLVPITILSLLVVDDDSSSYTQLAFFGLTMFGFAAAGYGAGKMAPLAPMAHGALGAMGTWVVIQGFGVLRRLVSGDAINWLGYPLQAMIAAGCGVFGAVFADWIRRSGRPVSVADLRRQLPK